MRASPPRNSDDRIQLTISSPSMTNQNRDQLVRPPV